MYHLRRIERISHEKIHNSGYGMSYHYITIVICPYYMTLQLPVKAAVFMMNIYIYIYIYKFLPVSKMLELSVFVFPI